VADQGCFWREVRPADTVLAGLRSSLSLSFHLFFSLRFSYRIFSMEKSVVPENETSSNPVTLLDVAREAGVSPSTVSRILNGTATVSAVKRKAVEDAIKNGL
jgi:transcriptional regulator with XRE-family HTH domain